MFLPFDGNSASSRPSTSKMQTAVQEPIPPWEKPGPIPYNGGYIQHRPHVFVVFYGSEWNEYPGVKEKLLDLYRWISGSAYQKTLTQYFDYAGFLGPETDLSSYTDTRIKAPSVLNTTVAQEEAQYSIANRADWSPVALDNQYVVVTPPGTPMGPEACAAHGWSGSFSWTMIPWSPSECQRGLPIWGAMQVSASHEWAESATDPIPVPEYYGWSNEQFGGELTDICNTGDPSEFAEASTGIYVAKQLDDYEWARFGVGGRCVVTDSSPARFTVITSSPSFRPHEMTLNGSVNPAGWPAYFQFALSGPGGTQYLPNPRTQNGLSWYGFSSAGQGVANQPVSANVQGLKGETSYQVRLDGVGALTFPVIPQEYGWPSIMPGNTVQVTTPDWRPAISYQSTTNRTTTAGTLNAKINPQGESTTYRFEWGETTSYGNTGPVPDASIGSGTSEVAVSRALSGLKPETTYHFRVVAKNGEGTQTGPDATFTTNANTPAYASLFGASGPGDGQFSRPLAMVADAPGGVPSGDVWIVDKLNNRVEKFNSKGQFVSKFGGFGTGNGQFNEPRAITVDGEGNLWVADAGNNRIEKFNSKGEYLTEIDSEGGLGFNSIDIPSGLAIARGGHIFVANQGSGGRVVELLTTPTGLIGTHITGYWLATTTPANMATDPQGDVWVVDTAENKLYEVPGSGGAPVARFGTTGTGPGQLSAPYAVAVKPSGTLLVSDRGNNRIQQFSQSGELLSSFGKGGNEPGQFCEPSGLALSSRGVIFVADSCHDKVQRWNQKTAPEAVTQPASSIAATSATLNARINPSGLATTYSFEYGKTSSYGSSIPVSPGSLGATFEDSAVAVPLTGLVPDTTYHRRVVATNVEGTTYGKDRTFVTASGTASFASSFSSIENGKSQLNRPLGMAADAPGGVPSGDIWVVDNKNNQVVKFKSNGEFVMKFGSFGTGTGQFDSPRGIAVDGQGNLWVTDAGNHRIQKFNSNGQYLAEIDSETWLGTKVLETPSGIAIGRGGHILVGDQGNGGMIEELRTSPLGGYYTVYFWGATTNPSQLTSDADGDVWAIDYQENKVYEIPEEGAPVARFGTGGTEPGQLSGPYGIALKPNGNFLISNRGNNRIQQFSPSGSYQLQFGAGGSGPGQFSEPSGMVVGIDGSVYVADSNNNRIQRWTFK